MARRQFNHDYVKDHTTYFVKYLPQRDYQARRQLCVNSPRAYRYLGIINIWLMSV